MANDLVARNLGQHSRNWLSCEPFLCRFLCLSTGIVCTRGTVCQTRHPTVSSACCDTCAGALTAMWSTHPAVCNQLCATCTGICSARCSRLKLYAEICKSVWPDHCRIEPRMSCHLHHRCFCWHYIRNSLLSPATHNRYLCGLSSTK